MTSPADSSRLAALEHDDARARETARTTFDVPVVLEAGAGTGKTATLVARLITWMVGPGWERSHGLLGREARTENIASRVVERIAAITFTEKAAVEMAERLTDGLDAVGQGHDLPGLAFAELSSSATERAVALSLALDRLDVGTIHAFCRRLLATDPLAAELHPFFDVDADGKGVRAICEEEVAKWLAVAYGDDPDDDAVALLEEGTGAALFVDALEFLVQEGVTPSDLERDPYPSDAVTEIAGQLAATCREFAAAASESGVAFPKSAKGSAGHVAMIAEAGVLLADVRDVEGLGAALPVDDDKKLAKRLREWERGTFGAGDKKVFGDRLDTIGELAGAIRNDLQFLARIDVDKLQRLFRLLSPLLRAVEDRRRETGVVTFGELLTKTRDLLGRDDEVRRRIRASLDLLLVDEVQDTDPVQYEIVESLTRSMDEDDDGPVLFMVGDPKQSIYGWRNADLAAYDEFVTRLVDGGARRERLSVNFRSVPAILDEVERLVDPVMIEDRGTQPAFQPLIAAPMHRNDRGFRDGGRRPVETWVSWRPSTEEGRTGPQTRSADASELEARAIAADVRALHDEHDVPWKQVGILLRATTFQESYLEALRAADIPFCVDHDRTYYQRREIIDAVSALRTIMDPHDHVALVGFLRSPWVGLPDAALVPLWSRRFPEHVGGLLTPDLAAWRRLRDIVSAAAADLPPDASAVARVSRWPAAVSSALLRVARLRDSFVHDAADIFVEKFRASFMAEAVEAARHLGRYRTANLERFFRELRDGLTDHPGGVDALLRELRVGVTDQSEVDAASPGDDTLDAVRLMTIHMAKGLDFDHVYFVGLHRGDRGGRRVGATGNVGRVDGRIELELFDVPTLGFRVVEERARRIEAAERVRLLYVATTRARRRLVLLGSFPKPDAALKEPSAAASFVDLLRHRDGGVDGERLMHLQDERGNAEVEFVDGTDVRRRLLAPPPVGAAVGGHHPRVDIDRPPIDFERIRRDGAELHRRRDFAAHRQDRPRFAVASASATDVDVDVDMDVAPPTPRLASPPAATASTLGIVIHRVFEIADLTQPFAPQLSTCTDEIERWCRNLATTSATADDLIAAVRVFLDHLATSRSAARFDEIAPHVVGREIPFVIAPLHCEEGPIDGVVGVMDLLYRDPADGTYVVVDFKTDAVSTDEEVVERSTHYRPQVSLGARAVVERGLGPVRGELWFLHPDRIVSFPVT